MREHLGFFMFRNFISEHNPSVALAKEGIMNSYASFSGKRKRI